MNDSLGHAAGDRLLVEAGERIRQSLRAGDTVSRFGGDEFTVLGATLDHRHDAIEFGQRLSRALGRAFRVADREIVLTSSIGIAFTFDQEADPDQLIHEADLAMYRAKERGGACHEVFGSSLRARTAQRRELETDLREALEEGQLRVAYQPQVELADEAHGGSGGPGALAAPRTRRHPRR